MTENLDGVGEVSVAGVAPLNFSFIPFKILLTYQARENVNET